VNLYVYVKRRIDVNVNSSLGKYYEGRWAYFSEVINIIQENDAWGRPQKYVTKEYEHNATVVPWPIKDKEYDLFIALQVWEHLEGKQKDAFKEVMRTSKMAILSFPYMWDCPKDNANYPEHHMINEEIISEWTLTTLGVYSGKLSELKSKLHDEI
jgi:hypothetical protein